MTDDPFVVHRSLLFTVAYEMLGSVADAEDVVQETWLRWADLGAATQADVRDPRAYLVRSVTRQALNRLRTQMRRREEYVGPWLPEPLLTSPDVAEDVELAESVSIAMLTVLETLGPIERAVFVLREVFETPYDEIAEAVGKTPAAVRQIAHRAREHVSARRPRVRVSQAEQKAVVERGSWPRSAAATYRASWTCSRPMSSCCRTVAAFLGGLARKVGAFETMPIWLNGGPAMRIDLDETLDTVASLVVEDGRITRIYVIRNPHKLARLDEPAELSR